jgi:hypothetical protein
VALRGPAGDLDRHLGLELISSAFVVSVLLMSALGLREPTVAMMAASILLVSCSIGVDMQHTVPTGWRLGSSRARMIARAYPNWRSEQLRRVS